MQLIYLETRYQSTFHILHISQIFPFASQYQVTPQYTGAVNIVLNIYWIVFGNAITINRWYSSYSPIIGIHYMKYFENAITIHWKENMMYSSQQRHQLTVDILYVCQIFENAITISSSYSSCLFAYGDKQCVNIWECDM